jgi:hypothetical protein
MMVDMQSKMVENLEDSIIWKECSWENIQILQILTELLFGSKPLIVQSKLLEHLRKLKNNSLIKASADEAVGQGDTNLDLKNERECISHFYKTVEVSIYL